MNWKLFISTFILIFLAELGDKTQLAAMARTASSGGAKWVVFSAASVALVLSTLVAVLFGHLLTKFIPESAIKLTAGILFVLFGVLIIRQVFAESPTEKSVSSSPGLVTNVALKWAAEFERAAADDFELLAQQTDDPDLRSLLKKLAEEEHEHFNEMAKAVTTHHALEIPAADADISKPERIMKTDDKGEAGSHILARAIEHEEATAQFYLELARITPLPSLRETFAQLARSEQNHVARLLALSEKS